MGKKRKKAPEGGGNWMDTYGDMVTLLLCFFVMMYSASNVDQQKWERIVKSFNPNAFEVSQIVTDVNAGGENGVAEMPGGTTEEGNVADGFDSFDDLYEKLKAAVAAGGREADVDLYKGDGYTFITFRNQVFFDGNSSVIREDGKPLLDDFASIISGVSEIQEVQVFGHTSQEVPDRMNNPETDRILAADRAAKIAAYIQVRCNLEPSKLVSVGYGQHRPVAPFDTPENRAKNRRVELLITKNGQVEKRLEEYYQEMNK